jgi:hypothetical protein
VHLLGIHPPAWTFAGQAANSKDLVIIQDYLDYLATSRISSPTRCSQINTYQYLVVHPQRWMQKKSTTLHVHYLVHSYAAAVLLSTLLDNKVAF